MLSLISSVRNVDERENHVTSQCKIIVSNKSSFFENEKNLIQIAFFPLFDHERNVLITIISIVGLFELFYT